MNILHIARINFNREAIFKAVIADYSEYYPNTCTLGIFRRFKTESKVEQLANKNKPIRLRVCVRSQCISRDASERDNCDIVLFHPSQTPKDKFKQQTVNQTASNNLGTNSKLNRE